MDVLSLYWFSLQPFKSKNFKNYHQNTIFSLKKKKLSSTANNSNSSNSVIGSFLDLATFLFLEFLLQRQLVVLDLQTFILISSFLTVAHKTRIDCYIKMSSFYLFLDHNEGKKKCFVNDLVLAHMNEFIYEFFRLDKTYFVKIKNWKLKIL